MNFGQQAFFRALIVIIFVVLSGWTLSFGASTLAPTAESAPFIDFQPVDQFVPQTMRFELTVGAGGSGPLNYQWRRNGTNLLGATNSNLVFQEIQLSDAGVYSVTLSNAYGQIVSRDARLTTVPTPPPGTVAAWGDNSTGQLNGNGATNIIAIVGAEVHTLGIRSNGTVVAWGANSQGQSNVPAGLSNVVAVAAGLQFSVALKRDGTVVAWGWNLGGQVNVPPGLSNVVAISAGNGCTAALRGNGTVIVWGACSSTQLDVPSSVSDVVSISMGDGYCLALRNDGTLLAWGVPLPPGLTNIVAVSSSSRVGHSLALRRDGTVVDLWGPSAPTGLNSIASIAAGSFHSLARRSNGTVVAWGDGEYGQTNVPSTLKGVTSIAAGSHSSFALTRQIVITTQPSDQYVPVGTNVTFRVFANGTPVPRFQWRFNGVFIPGATNNLFTITNTQPEHAGYYSADVWNTSGVLPTRSARLALIPNIVVQPQSQIVTVGRPLILTLSVSGTPPFTFTWFKNNRWIADTTEPVFQLEQINPSDAGRYSVYVENDAGSFYSVMSASAYLDVIPLLEFEKSAEDVTLMWQRTTNALILQFATNLVPPITWINVPTPTNSINISPASPQRFYRLTPNR